MEENGKKPTKKTTLDVKEAELISDDLKVEIFVNAIDVKTKGQAWLIDTLPISNEKTEYTILQKDTKNSWLAMRNILSANESVVKQFSPKKKSSENLHYGQIPLYFAFAVVTALMLYFIYIVMARKLLIFERKDTWLIIQGFVLLSVIEFLLYYYIHTQKIDVISFQSYTHGRIATFTIYFESRVQTINAMVYTGRFVDFKHNTAKYIFGYNASEIQGGLKDEDDKQFFIDKIRFHVSERDRLQNELVQRYMEVQRLSSKVETLQYSKSTRLGENKDINAESEMLEKLEEQKQEVESEFEVAEKQLEAEIAKHESEIKSLQKKYYAAIDKMISTSIDERKKEEIINADLTISKLKNENARQRILMLGMTNDYNGVVDDYSDLAENFDDRVDMAMAESDKNSAMIMSHSNGNGSLAPGDNQSNQSLNIDWGSLISRMLPLLILSFLFVMILNRFSSIIESLALLDSWAIAAVLFLAIFLLIMFWVGFSRFWNKGSSYASNADMTYKKV